MKMPKNKNFTRISLILLVLVASSNALNAWPFRSNNDNNQTALESAFLGIKKIADSGITIGPETRKTLDGFSQALKDASDALNKGIALTPNSIASLNQAADAINNLVKDGVKVEPATITMFNGLSESINLLIKEGVTIAPETLKSINSLDASLKFAVQNGIKTTVTPDIAGFTKVIKTAGVGVLGFGLTCVGARLIYKKWHQPTTLPFVWANSWSGRFKQLMYNQYTCGAATMIGGMAMLLSCDKIVNAVS